MQLLSTEGMLAFERGPVAESWKRPPYGLSAESAAISVEPEAPGKVCFGAEKVENEYLRSQSQPEPELINTKNLPVIGFSIECHRDLLFVDAHPKKTT